MVLLAKWYTITMVYGKQITIVKDGLIHQLITTVIYGGQTTIVRWGYVHQLSYHNYDLR